MTYCTPYLLSLGMSKQRMSLVWIAGPLSGLVTQPIIGMKSDKSRNRYGRRRPYMMAGTLAVVLCYLVLGWTQEIVGVFVSDAEMVRCGQCQGGQRLSVIRNGLISVQQREGAILLAVGNIYVLDFMINICKSLGPTSYFLEHFG